MRRTYRSKKDTGGAIDHRDVLLNKDEKSSAFDAFYIQNLKQTKRELSCVASTNVVGVASNKVRKRKYVKRLVKEVEPERTRETLSSSAYLTPDKSIRVNKILDPFDLLLNSSPVNEECFKPKIVETFVPKKESKTYVRKRKPKVKKINYSSTDSDKENTIDVTDIKAHELLVERAPDDKLNHVDDSIQKIVNNPQLINNWKRKGSNGSFNTSYKNRNRLTKNYQSPILQKSPLCSTPFKEKYRGVSIFKFSPIAQNDQESPNNVSVIEEKDDSNHSIILVGKSLALKASSGYKVSPLAHVPNVSIKNVSDSLFNNKHFSPKEVSKNEDENEIELVDDKAHSNVLITNNASSSLQMTDAEPFLGFSDNEIQNLTKIRMKMMSFLNENQSMKENILDPNGSQTETDTNNASLHFNEHQLGTTSNDPSINIDNSGNKVGSNIINPNDSSINSDVDNIERVTNKTVNDSVNRTKNSIHTSRCNTSNSSVSSQNSENESLYDTCNSDQSSIAELYQAKREPIVVIKRMSDSTLLKYYEKILFEQQNEETSEPTDKEDFESMDNNSNSSMIIDSDGVEVKPKDIIITDSSTTEDILPNEGDYDENNAESDDKDDVCVSFVTTRKRNEITKDSMFMFDQSYGSGSTECDKTVLSNNRVSNEKSDVDNVLENSIHDIDLTEDCKGRNTDNINAKINIRKSTTKSLRLSNESNVNKKVSKIITRKSSRVSRQSSSSSSYDKKLSASPCNKRKSRNTTRKISRFTKLNYSISSESENEKAYEANNKNVFVNNMLEIESHNDEKVNKRIAKPRKSSILPKRSYSVSSESENEKTILDLNETNNATVVDNNNFERVSTNIGNREANPPLQSENVSCTFNESTVRSRLERPSMYASGEVKPTIILQPGKKWERSLSIYRRMTMADHIDHSILEESMQNKGRKYRQSVINTMEMQECRDSLHNDSINSRRSTFVCNLSRPTIRFVKDPNFSRVSLNTSSIFDDLKGFLSEECDDTVIELSKLSIADSEHEVTVLDNFHDLERVTTARDFVLRRCNQTDALLFDECYPDTVLKNCHKIGEGVYGEVFLWRGRDGRARVMKIVPIAGSVKVNGEAQKDFHEIISEIVIAMELSALRAPIADIERQLDEGSDIHALDLHAIENATDIFNEVLAVRCVQGPYPSRLLDLWDLFDECKGSENDNPAALPADQRYIVLELANAGQDLESFQFASALQAYALFQQIAFGLAVAEEAFQFEHRDLHWGNVLIAPTEQKYATFILRGRAYRVPRRGVAATVIDYSLSRVSLRAGGAGAGAGGAALYNDLAPDEQLFDAVGDYQFEVYRLMRDKLGNDWKNFEPYTNILWLHYIADKMITALRYKRTNTKIHKHHIEKLTAIKNSILEYGSAVQYVLTNGEF